MKKVAHPLKQRQRGQKVANLHEILLHLHEQGLLPLDEDVRETLIIRLREDCDKRYFGAATRDIVIAFQETHDLESTGEVDIITAEFLTGLINIETPPKPPATKPPATTPSAKIQPKPTGTPASTGTKDPREKALSAVLKTAKEKNELANALKNAKGDWAAARKNLTSKLSKKVLQTLDFSNSVAEWSGNNVALVSALAKHSHLRNLRDVALHFGVDELAKEIDPNSIPAAVAGTTRKERSKNFATDLHNRLFRQETSAVLQRMATKKELPISDTYVRSNVAKVLGNVPDLNINNTSIYNILADPNAFKSVPKKYHDEVSKQLKTLQRLQAISPTTTSLSAMMEANFTSAQQVTSVPESQFMAAHAKKIGGKYYAQQIYNNAAAITARNEQAGMAIYDAYRGATPWIVGADTKQQNPIKILVETIGPNITPPLSLDTLFGDKSMCECDDCLSVYSPASYFVELLNYLRNNNLKPTDPHTGSDSITGTALEALLRRRPDLGCLELTCENTFTELPYIDLANEVMEGFIEHQDAYDNSGSDANSRKTMLDAFNVDGETSGELLAEPQHVNYHVYCILKNAVYPFTLPYHQPIDATRIYLDYLGTSRYEMLDTFRVAKDCAVATLPDLTRHQETTLKALHKEVQDRAVDAEFLGLTQEEYIILCKEAFWPKNYFEITTSSTTIGDRTYQEKIGVKSVWNYYGYNNRDEMLGSDTSHTPKGLTFVEKEFLPRTGLQYTDLLALLKTRYINPELPRGEALAILESLQINYRYLQQLVDTSKNTPHERFRKLIKFLIASQSHIPWLQDQLSLDPCKQTGFSPAKQKEHFTRVTQELISQLKEWVYCYFERIGNLVVLVSDDLQQQLSHLNTLSTVSDVWIDPKSRAPALAPPKDTCDLGKIRMIHLDGTPLTVDEYDRMHRFIRLWRKLGWSIDEVDKALTGSITVAATDSSGDTGTDTGTPSTGSPSTDCHVTKFDDFSDGCTGVAKETGISKRGAIPGSLSRTGACPDPVDASAWDITHQTLKRIAEIRKVQNHTGLPLARLLCFWADISTAGDKPLYATLFLNHNLTAMDPVFKPDEHGIYLSQAAKISEHIPVLMAAFKLTSDDINAITGYCHLTDELTLASVSVIYRYSLLAKLLGVKPAKLSEVIDLFGDPFANPGAMLKLLDLWGKMEDAGFEFRQLYYIIKDTDDPSQPLAPTRQSILSTSRTLFAGISAIASDYQDLPAGAHDQATDALVRSVTGNLYPQDVVGQIVAFLDGTTVYSCNLPDSVPAPDLSLLSTSGYESLAKKFKYIPASDSPASPAVIQVTGILTPDELDNAKSLLRSSTAWADAINSIISKPIAFFNDTLLDIFPDSSDHRIRTTARSNLLAGDVTPARGPASSSGTNPHYTAPGKRFYFLEYFLPFLRARLADRLILNKMEEVSGLSNDVINVLLGKVLHADGSDTSDLADLRNIIEEPSYAATDPKSYSLLPSADGKYTIYVNTNSAPTGMTLDNQTFTQQPDSDTVWFNGPQDMKGGSVHKLVLTDQIPEDLSWKTEVSSMSAIPQSALVPDYAITKVEKVLVSLTKCALLLNGFKLSAAESSFFQASGDVSDPFDFNKMTVDAWERLRSYASLRDKLPKTATSLLDLFTWAKTHPHAGNQLGTEIAKATLWIESEVESLISSDHLNLEAPANFINEKALLQLDHALAVAKRIGVDIDRLFEWAAPGSKFLECHQISESIHKAIRSRFNEDDWEQVVRPLNNKLREHQKQALIAYLLVQPDLREWGVIDADSLFEFFLIDVQMGACMETSRIKQAISSVQLFVQRCMLGQEENRGAASVLPDVLDRGRWSWTQKYRVWEANRKVFLYPENWIEPSLRDDKSQFYKELESELLQKDITPQTVQDALKNYLYKVDEVAHLQVVGLFAEQQADAEFSPFTKLHVFGRTQNAPYSYFYRYYEISLEPGSGRRQGYWYPWERMQVDIPSYEVPNDPFGHAKGSGTYLIPVVWNQRLFVFFPEITFKTKPRKTSGGVKGRVSSDHSTFSADDNAPLTYAEIKMGWSEYRNGKWTQKQVSKDSVTSNMDSSAVPHLAFVPDIKAADVKIAIFHQPEWASEPAICGLRTENGLKRLDVFTRGKDDAIWHKKFVQGTWYDWVSLGDAEKFDLRPTAVARAGGVIDVFALGKDKKLYQKHYENNQWAGEWTVREHGDVQFKSSPAACFHQHNNNQRLDVFLVDTNDKIQHLHIDGNDNPGWDNTDGPSRNNPGSSANVKLPLSAIGRESGYIDLFALSSSSTGTLSQNSFHHSGTSFHNLTDFSPWSEWSENIFVPDGVEVNLKVGPASCSWDQDRVDVFALGEDKAIWHAFATDEAADNWTPLKKGEIEGAWDLAPAAVSWDAGKIDMIVGDANKSLWHLPYDGGWLRPEPIGAPITDAVPVGEFSFQGNQLNTDSMTSNISTSDLPDYFHFFTKEKTIHSLQLSVVGVPSGRAISPQFIQSAPYFTSSDAAQHQFNVNVTDSDVHRFYYPYVHDLLGQVSADGVSGLYDYFQNNLTPADMPEVYGDDVTTTYHELKRAYSIYDWEIGFHAVMQIVDRLLNAQRFDQALQMLHYVLDPTAEGNGSKRFWQFPPFKRIDASKSVKDILLALRANQFDTQVNAWRAHPFQPHVIARGRPVAYMKYAAMKYIEILIAYGDYYFRQFTLETLPLAIQCYVMASHIFGRPQQKIPKQGKVKPHTYMSLLNQWDAFGNAMVEMELVFPYSAITLPPIGSSGGSDSNTKQKSSGNVPLTNIFSFASSLYFCIPDNPRLTELRNTIDDRLFKIRHCQDIHGVVHHLPLFEPPIDPGLLVQAEAQGLDLGSVLNELDSPMPNYRFYYLLQKALELCNEVKALGNTFLSLKEKGDAEALSLMRARHQNAIQNLVMTVKKQQQDEAQKSLDALKESRRGPVSRMQYYLKLIGEDLNKVPDVNSGFDELHNQIDKPIDMSGLKLDGYEKEEMDMAAASRFVQASAGQMETLASIMNILPNISANFEPFGEGASISFGGSNIGAYFQAQARIIQIHANDLSFQSTNAGRKAGFLRQLQDRVEQANMAGFEIKHIDKQILAQQIRLDMTGQEITNQQKQIDQAKEVEDFLRDKYTSQELYSWMEGQVRTLYHQAYTMAYDLARRAEAAFRFERGPDAPSFIKAGYWDVGHDGLLAGEQLYVGLKQLEAAYQESRPYDFEVSMPISLRQLDPFALLQLKEKDGNGNYQCEFSLPEVLFDMVRPGDYMRRIKSVALTIPCVVGPYTSMSCTLRLLEHKFRSKPESSSQYSAQSEDDFSTMNVPISSVATSTSQSDSGMFQLNFHGERYLPFEGAGAISKWRLEIPAALPQFDYSSITDVIIQLRYTAKDGGKSLQTKAKTSVMQFVENIADLSREQGLFAAFDLKNDFPDAWNKAMEVPSSGTKREIVIKGLRDRLPLLTQGQDVIVKDVYLYYQYSSDASAPTWALSHDTSSAGSSGGASISLSTTGAPDVGTLSSVSAAPNVHMGSVYDKWTVALNGSTTVPELPEKLFMFIRYELPSPPTH